MELKVQYEYPMFYDYVEPKGALAINKESHACFYYAMLAARARGLVGSGIDSQILEYRIGDTPPEWKESRDEEPPNPSLSSMGLNLLKHSSSAHGSNGHGRKPTVSESTYHSPCLKLDPEGRSYSKTYRFNTPVEKSIIVDGSEYVIVRAQLVAKIGIVATFLRKDLRHAARTS